LRHVKNHEDSMKVLQLDLNHNEDEEIYVVQWISNAFYDTKDWFQQQTSKLRKKVHLEE